MNHSQDHLLEAAASDPALAQICDEVIGRLQAGDRVDVASLALEHPEHADQLRRLLPALEAMVDLGASSVRNHSHAASSPSHGASGPTPGVLGDYRILREIGRGGMGVVYEAEQCSLNRRVALKVLPFAAALDPRQLQRFKVEAQAAAQLQHQNIVPVYGVGCERGVYYYAMQFVEGPTLAAVIHELRQLAGLEVAEAMASGAARGPASELASGRWEPVPNGTAEPSATSPYPPSSEVPQTSASTTPTPQVAGLSVDCSIRTRAFFRTVANLGVQAAQALEQAHQLGVVHRDIKPANLLVDVRGNLWITDFGLAQVRNETRLTATGDLLGTLRYMSPEQALGQRGVVDHGADIYSLGATLYELLTLEPALVGHDRAGLLRQIAFEEPRSPRRVNRAIPAELETIILKAMAKSPSERYATAQELADDLGRFLRDEPIRAKRSGLSRRVRKWARRHRPIVGAAAVCLLVAVVALGGSLGWIARDRAGRREAHAREADLVLHQAARMLGRGDPEEADAWRRRAEVVLTGIEPHADVRRRLGELRDDLAMVAQLREIRERQSDVKEDHFDFGQADSGYLRAFRDYGIDVTALAPAEAAARIRRRNIRRDLVLALDDWSDVRRMSEPAETGWRRLIAIAQAADPEDESRRRLRAAWLQGPADRVALERLAASNGLASLPAPTLALLGISLRRSGAIEDAVAVLTEAQRRHPADFWINHDLAFVLMEMRPPRWQEALPYYTAALALRPQSPGVRINLSIVLSDHGDYDGVIALCEEAIRLKPDYAVAYQNLGIALRKKGRLAEAETAYRNALALHQRLVAGSPTFPRFRDQLANTYDSLGKLLREAGRSAEAESAYRDAFALYKGLVADRPAVPNYRAELARSSNNLGYVLNTTRQPAEAEVAYRDALALYQGLVAEAPTDPEYRAGLARTSSNLGHWLQKAGRWVEAETICRDALTLYQGLVAETPADPDYRNGLADTSNCLGVVLNSTGRRAEAEAAYRDALALWERLVVEAPSVPRHAVDLGGVYCNLGIVARNQGRPEAALEWYAKAIRTLTPEYDREPRPENARVYLKNAYWGRVEALRRLGRHAEAIPDWDLIIAQFGEGGRRTAQSLRAHDLAHIGDHAQAVAVTDELARTRDGAPILYYNLGCVCSVASAVPGIEDALKKQYAARAIALLRQAVQKGFRDAALMKTDQDLDPLRSREDFANLLAELEWPHGGLRTMDQPTTK